MELKRFANITAIVTILLLTQCTSAFFVLGVKATQYNALDYPGNHCLNFTVANQRVDCGYHAVFQAAAPTIELWVKPKYNVQIGSYPKYYGSYWGTLVCLREPGWTSGWFFGFDYAKGLLTFLNDANGVFVYFDKSPWYNDSWYYVAVTYDPSLKYHNLVFYVNGTVDSYHNATTAFVYHNTELQIGSEAGVNIPYLGLLDEVRLWNVSRTRLEIQDTWDTSLIYPNDTATAYPDLVGGWHFDSQSHGNYPDYSIYHNDAVPTVPPGWVKPGAPLLALFPSIGVVGMTGYKFVFKQSMVNLFSSQAIIDYYWNFTVDKWNGAQWVAAGISGSSTPVVGYAIPALTTVDLPYYVYLLPMSGPNAVKWGDWLRINHTFHWTYSSTNYSIDYTAKLNVHLGDIAGAASVTFPYLGADGVVNVLDINPIAFNWKPPKNTVAWTGLIDPTDAQHRADINRDGIVNVLDINPIAFKWLKTWTNTPPP